jgi:hypothetical protein
MYNKELPEIKVTKDKGYAYFIDYTHPLACGNSGKVYLHRHVASIAAGRWLNCDEQVHHEDNNKLNNAIDNLKILSASEHSKIHKPDTKTELICPICQSLFIPKEVGIVFCSNACAKHNNIKNKEITREYLNELIPKYTWVELGKLLGYSDSGIKKRAKSLGCEIPIRRKCRVGVRGQPSSLQDE